MPDNQITSLPEPGTGISADFQAAQIANSGAGYASRWVLDLDTGQVVQRAVASDQSEMPFDIEQGDHGEMHAMVPMLANGYVQSRAHISPQYTDVWEAVSATSGKTTDRRDMMKRARKYWEIDGLVYKCVKFLTQLCNAKLIVESDDDSTRDLVDIWINTAMGHAFREQFYREYYRSGYVVTLKTLVPYVPRNFKPGKIPQSDEPGMVKALAIMEDSERDRQEYLTEARRYQQYSDQARSGLCSPERLRVQASIMISKQYKWLKGLVPAAYSLLDPLDVELHGPAEMSMLRQPFLKVSDELQQAVSHPTAAQADIVSALPEEIVQQIKAGQSKVWLSPNICSITYADKQDYEDYPTPMVIHAEYALQMKAGLIAADKRTLDSVRDRILKVTIGSDAHPVLHDEPLLKLANNFKNPNRAFTVFWNHTLKIEWVEPPLESFMNKEKYDLWNDEIRTVFGISRIFTGTSESAGAIGNSAMNFSALVEEVQSAQAAFIEFAKGQINLLRQALGISKEVNIRYPKIGTDATEMIAVLKGLVEGGLLDPQSALETIGFHYPTIRKRLEATKKLRENGLFVPVPSANNMGPDGTMLDKSKGGKPRKDPLADNNKNKVGKPNVKGKASAAARFMETPDGFRLVIDADIIDDEARDMVAESFGVAHGYVVSRAEFKQAFGSEVKFVQPLPTLDTREVLTLARNAAKTTQQILVEADKGIASLREANKGKRGPWLTQAMKDEVLRAAEQTVLGPLQVDNPDWQAWMEEGRAIAADAGQADAPQWEGRSLADLAARVDATVLTRMRYDKLSKQS